MLLPLGVKIYLAVGPVDMRGSFYRLASHVRATLGGDPQCGHLFVFVNKRRTLAKILFWDRSGYCIFAKKLEQGTFKLPDEVPPGASQHEVDFASLTLFLEGIDLRGARRRKSYEPPRFGPPQRES